MLKKFSSLILDVKNMFEEDKLFNFFQDSNHEHKGVIKKKG
jgi:hypothetical protein